MSAAFILISSKVGDLIGRKRAYVLGLLGYAVGALAMALAQNLPPVIIFWAIFGGLGASLLLPSMQSLIHGNFEGAAQKRVYALVGASAAIAAAIGPLLGGFITTFLSWRVGFLLELVVIGVVLLGIRLVQDVPVHRASAASTSSAPSSRSSAWAASCSASSSGRRAARPSALLIAIGAVVAWSLLAWWLVRRKRDGEAAADRPGPLPLEDVPARDLRPDAAADRARRRDDRAADLPADGPRVQRPAGGPVARAAVAEHVRRGHRSPGSGPATAARRPSSGSGSCCCPSACSCCIPIVPARGFRAVARRSRS